MSEWIILVDGYRDLPQGETIHKVLSTRDYLGRRGLFEGRRPQIVNLSRSYAYQSAGYYAALLAEARGHRTIPTVQTMLELQKKTLYADALPELETALARDLARAAEPPERPFRLKVFFGRAERPGFERFASLLFDWYRTPAIEVSVCADEPVRIKRLALLTLPRISKEDRPLFDAALDRYTSRRWKQATTRKPVRYSLAVLHNPREPLPPSDLDSLKDLATAGAKMGVEVEPIQKGEFGRIAEFDALFIRETTSIDSHTYRFARRAEQEGQARHRRHRLDDPLHQQDLSEGDPRGAEDRDAEEPRRRVCGRRRDGRRPLGLPVVVKDSRRLVQPRRPQGRHAARAEGASRPPLRRDGLPPRAGLHADPRSTGASGCWAAVRSSCASTAWRRSTGRSSSTRPAASRGKAAFARSPWADAPAEVVEAGVRAAAAIGDGLLRCGPQERTRGAAVIEVNDNPNMDTRVEGAVLKERMWTAPPRSGSWPGSTRADGLPRREPGGRRRSRRARRRKRGAPSLPSPRRRSCRRARRQRGCPGGGGGDGRCGRRGGARAFRRQARPGRWRGRPRRWARPCARTGGPAAGRRGALRSEVDPGGRRRAAAFSAEPRKMLAVIQWRKSPEPARQISALPQSKRRSARSGSSLPSSYHAATVGFQKRSMTERSSSTVSPAVDAGEEIVALGGEVEDRRVGRGHAADEGGSGGSSRSRCGSGSPRRTGRSWAGCGSRRRR